jgi:hypothetical protein
LAVRVIKRIVLSAAALSPSMVALFLHEFAMSLVFMLIGLTGMLSVVAATIAISPKLNAALEDHATPKVPYPSLLVGSAFAFLQDNSPDPVIIRATMQKLLAPTHATTGFVTTNDQIAMILAQILARWGETDVLAVSDDQARELWLVERLMRASPAEAGALANFFIAPNAMLTMRDQIAVTEIA